MVQKFKIKLGWKLEYLTEVFDLCKIRLFPVSMIPNTLIVQFRRKMLMLKDLTVSCSMNGYKKILSVLEEIQVLSLVGCDHLSVTFRLWI